MSQCEVKTHHLADAERSYELARTIARESGDKKLESFASATEADVAAGLHDNRRALELYQAALNLDTVGSDLQSEATDWYNYGLFLRNAGFPSRLAYEMCIRDRYKCSW